MCIRDRDKYVHQCGFINHIDRITEACKQRNKSVYMLFWLFRTFLQSLFISNATNPPVSYTHLDVYKRQIQFHPVFEELLHALDTRPPVRKEV